MGVRKHCRIFSKAISYETAVLLAAVKQLLDDPLRSCCAHSSLSRGLRRWFSRCDAHEAAE